MKTTLTILGLAILMHSAVAAAEPGSDAKVARSFLDAHCVRCHGKKKPEGNISLLYLSADPKTPKDIEIWKRVYEQLDNGQMPPPDSKQPPSADRSASSRCSCGMFSAIFWVATKHSRTDRL